MAVPEVERQLCAILAADVVGYSRLMETNEASTLAAIRAMRADVIDPLLTRHHGHIVKLMGDGMLVQFGSVVDAVHCAVAIQRAVQVAQAGVVHERRIVFRIGVNLGDVVTEGEDLLGDGVNVAARLEQLCPPGGLLVSGTAYDQLLGKFDLPLDYAGAQKVKNISRPIRIYRVRLEGGVRPWRLWARPYLGRVRVAGVLLVAVLVAGGLWWLLEDETSSVRASIAVLPFDNLGGDEATGRLADGITEDIITDLTRFRDLDVIARNSTSIYKGKPVDVKQVGKDLNVHYVLEGSIQRQADDVRVTAQLIDATSGSHVWAERWDRPIEDIFLVQSEVSASVVNQLAGSDVGMISLARQDGARRKRPTELSAYDLYWLGLEANNRTTEEGFAEGIRLLKKSVEIDPQFARAWVGLAWAYSGLAIILDDPGELENLRLTAARKAVELDPTDAEAHAALGFMLGLVGDLKLAEAEYDTALRLNPSSAKILAQYAYWASSFGKVDLGVEAAERAMRLDPNLPAWAPEFYRYAFFMAGRYEDALRMHERRPKSVYYNEDYVFGAAILAGLGRLEEARAAVTQTLAEFPDMTIESFAGLPWWAEHERKRWVETMKAAGFPLCAVEATIAEDPELKRLPECVRS